MGTKGEKLKFKREVNDSIIKDSIDFLSLGGLVKGLTIDDITLGSSSSRNPKFVNILHRLNYVEAYGTGIPRILKKYRTCLKQPEIKVGPNSFLIHLPKIKYSEDYINIINYLKENDFITREIIEKITNYGKHKTIDLINSLITNDVIVKDGNGKSITYKLK